MTGSFHSLIFYGSANVSSYQQALSTITYQNNAPEPVPATRVITYTVFDGIHYSNTTSAYLTLDLVNDNVLTLSCGVENVIFVEGSTDPVLVANQLSLVDFDEDHMITRATVELEAPQDGDELNIDHSIAPLLEISNTTDHIIHISGVASDDQYQVKKTHFIYDLFQFFFLFLRHSYVP